MKFNLFIFLVWMCWEDETVSGTAGGGCPRGRRRETQDRGRSARGQYPEDDRSSQGTRKPIYFFFKQLNLIREKLILIFIYLRFSGGASFPRTPGNNQARSPPREPDSKKARPSPRAPREYRARAKGKAPYSCKTFFYLHT